MLSLSFSHALRRTQELYTKQTHEALLRVIAAQAMAITSLNETVMDCSLCRARSVISNPFSPVVEQSVQSEKKQFASQPAAVSVARSSEDVKIVPKAAANSKDDTTVNPIATTTTATGIVTASKDPAGLTLKKKRRRQRRKNKKAAS